MPALARAGVIAVALLLHVADALLTYFIIVTFRGIEGNPFLQHFNHEPSSIFYTLAFTALALTAIYLLAVRGARSRHVPVAATSRAALTMFAVFIVLKTLAVANNALILYSSVQLFEFTHFVVLTVVLSAAVAMKRLQSELTALRRRGRPLQTALLN